MRAPRTWLVLISLVLVAALAGPALAEQDEPETLPESNRDVDEIVRAREQARREYKEMAAERSAALKADQASLPATKDRIPGWSEAGAPSVNPTATAVSAPAAPKHLGRRRRPDRGLRALRRDAPAPGRDGRPGREREGRSHRPPPPARRAPPGPVGPATRDPR